MEPMVTPERRKKAQFGLPGTKLCLLNLQRSLNKIATDEGQTLDGY